MTSEFDTLHLCRYCELPNLPPSTCAQKYNGSFGNGQQDGHFAQFPPQIVRQGYFLTRRNLPDTL